MTLLDINIIVMILANHPLLFTIHHSSVSVECVRVFITTGYVVDISYTQWYRKICLTRTVDSSITCSVISARTATCCTAVDWSWVVALSVKQMKTINIYDI